MATETDRPFSQILQDIVANVQDIIRLEVRLAKAEMSEQAGKAARGVTTLAIGAGLAFFGLGFVLLAVVYALSTVMAPWAAAAIVGVVLGAVAAMMMSAGRKHLRGVDMKPERTIQSVKENVKWAKDQTR